MDLNLFRQNRAVLKMQEPQYRSICSKCRQPTFTCYCQAVQSFDPQIKFVILIHTLEAKRRVATGRMSHLCLENSELIRGHDFSRQARVNQILSDPSLFPVVLFPGPTSTDFSYLTKAERFDYFPKDKKIAVFVLDGTWDTAKKMIRLSENLRSLPRFCFTPTTPSSFRVRKQPKVGCYSTIEAIHQTIDLIGPLSGFDPSTRKHDVLLRVFKQMVDQQLTYVKKSNFRRVR